MEVETIWKNLGIMAMSDHTSNIKKSAENKWHTVYTAENFLMSFEVFQKYGQTQSWVTDISSQSKLKLSGKKS